MSLSETPMSPMRFSGTGPDILIFNPLGSHLELTWDLPTFGDFYTRIASIGRLIIFDRRGFGLPDAIPRDAIPTWEDFAEDGAATGWHPGVPTSPAGTELGPRAPERARSSRRWR
jgi:hypothetical protein